MDNLRWEEKIVQKKVLIILYFVASIILILLSVIPIGHGIKDNKPISVDLTAISESYEKNINAREYSESYNLTVDDDIQIDNLSVTYMTDDTNFKGVLEATISEDEQILKSVSIDMGNTISEEGSVSFSTANVDFGFLSYNSHSPKPILLKGHTYSLQIQIHTNLPNYDIMESHILSGNGSLCKFSTDKSIISGITYTRVSLIRYGEIFYGIVPFLIIVGGILLLKYLNINPVKNKYVKCILNFFQKYHSEIILILLFIYLALYQFYHAYIEKVGISPDSTRYLKEATAILSGYGFNDAGLSGYDSWFASWPIGYPLLIAAVAFVTGRNVYLSSKILSVILVGIFLLLLHIRFKKDAWIYSLCLLNLGFLQIYCYTWSENPFILGLLIFCLILSYIIESDEIKTRWFILLGCCSAFLFLCRYIGTFSLMIIGLAFVLYLGKYILYNKYRNKEIRSKLIGFIISGMISFLFVVSYYAMNYIMCGSISGANRSEWWDEYTSLTNGLWNALTIEFFNAIHIPSPSIILNLNYHYKIGLWMMFLLAIIYLLYKQKSKDFKLIFISVGVLYNLIFIFIRFHSSMDGFGYRFFVPSSILITIGVLGCFAKLINKYKYWIAFILIVLLTLSNRSLIYSCKDVNRDSTAYRKFQVDAEHGMSEIPYRSTVLGVAENVNIGYQSAVFRPDVNCVYESINTDDTMDDLFKRYSNSDYICIKNKFLKTILFNSIYDYDESIINFFWDSIDKASPDEEYVVISVKEHKIVK